MHLLYLDDAGSAANPSEQYLVLGGLSVFEAQAHWITQQLDRLAGDINPADPHSVEFHASEIFSRRTQPWKRLSRDEARDTIKSVLDVLADAYDTARAFACVVHCSSIPTSRDSARPRPVPTSGSLRPLAAGRSCVCLCGTSILLEK